MAELENKIELEQYLSKKKTPKQERLINFLSTCYGEDTANLYKSILILFDEKLFNVNHLIIMHLMNELLNSILKQEGECLINEIQEKFQQDIVVCHIMYDKSLYNTTTEDEYNKVSNGLAFFISEKNKLYYILKKYIFSQVSDVEEENNEIDKMAKEIHKAKASFNKIRHTRDKGKIFCDENEFKKMYEKCESFLFKLSEYIIEKNSRDVDDILKLSMENTNA